MSTTTSLWMIGLPLIVACARDERPATAPAAPSAPAAQPSSQTAAGGMQHGMHGMHGMHGGTALVDPGAPGSRDVRDAVAMLHPSGGSNVTGWVRFHQTDDQGLDVTASIDGLPGGRHAYHVHVYGDCSSPDAKSAGPHFHFTGSSFDKTVNIITGNLGELSPQSDGTAMHNTRLADAQLHGPYSVIGRAVVVHAKPNDPKVTPDGGAGDRIACGVIGVGNPESSEAARTAAAALPR